MQPLWLSRIPIVLSTLVFPGSGQLLQRRWAAGAAFFVGYLSAFVAVMLTAGKSIISYYRLGFGFDSFEPEPIRISNLLLAFGIALLIYIINIIDVSVAHHRMRSRQALEDFMKEHAPEQVPENR